LSVDRTRSVTLVVVDSAGSVRGSFGPTTVADPWWQEVGPVATVLPGSVVLRMLSAEPDPEEPFGGAVTYLVEFDGDVDLDPCALELAPDPLRMPWAEVGGPNADRAWASGHVTTMGAPEQERAWNLSTVWRAPTDSGIVWFKGVPPFMQHESAVLRLLEGHPVPTLLVADGHRQLLASMPGRDGYRADAVEQGEMIDALLDLQVAAAPRVDEFAAAGVPDLRTDGLRRRLTEIVDRCAPDDATLRTLVDELPQRLDVVDELGPPPTLVHGDAHPGNCRLGTQPPVWFDWGDSFIGSPLFDLGTADRWPGVGFDGWLDRIEERWPGGDIRAAWSALEPVAMLRLAWVYQHFLDNIEASEHAFHADDVPEYLERTRALL